MKRAILLAASIAVSMALIAAYIGNTSSASHSEIICCPSDALAYSATCTGAKNCKACKNCKYCKHCKKNGGTCGVCR